MKISDEQAAEIKRSAENLYRLTKLLLTETRKEYSQIKIPKGQNQIRYKNMVEKYERPEEYYHFQMNNMWAEIRKGKQDYYVKTNIKIKIKTLIEDTKEIVKNAGYTNIYEYHNELLEAGENNFLKITENIINKLINKDNNILIFE